MLEPRDERLAASFEERCVTAVPAEPIALGLRGDTLLVTSGAGSMLTVLRTGDLGKTRSFGLPLEPRSVLVDGSIAFVDHAMGGVVSVVDLATPEGVVGRVKLNAGRRALDSGTLTTHAARQTVESLSPDCLLPESGSPWCCPRSCAGSSRTA